jgi:hypothetical protein
MMLKYDCAPTSACAAYGASRLVPPSAKLKTMVKDNVGISEKMEEIIRARPHNTASPQYGRSALTGTNPLEPLRPALTAFARWLNAAQAHYAVIGGVAA